MRYIIRFNNISMPVEVKIDIDKIYDIFPKTDGMRNMRVTDVGLYSVTKKNEAYFITNMISNFFNSSYTITDTTACIGGNTISFMLNDKIDNVNSVEIDDLHYEILLNNVGLYKNSGKVNIVKGNYLCVMRDLKQDVIFYDLPWGGVNYKENREMSLGLNEEDGTYRNIVWIVNEMKAHSKIQVLKLPLNFEFTNFLCEVKYSKIKLHKIYNKFTKKLYYYIMILVNNI